MDFEIEQRCGAGYGERSEDRSNRRNGYGSGSGRRGPGQSTLRIPKLRRGSYFPGFLGAAVDELVKAMGMSGISKSQVSRLCGEIDERVGALLKRPIEGDWPYLWVDAKCVKVRQASRIVSVAVIMQSASTPAACGKS